MKFVSKPVWIDAWQVGSDMKRPHWIDVELEQGNLQLSSDGKRWFIHDNEHTTEGPLEASNGDWIIRGTEGELYPCSDVVFQKKYADTSKSAIQEFIEMLDKKLAWAKRIPISVTISRQDFERLVKELDPDISDKYLSSCQSCYVNYQGYQVKVLPAPER